MENKSKHNGWSNYNTWRVALEAVDFDQFTSDNLASEEDIKNIVEQAVFGEYEMSTGSCLVEDFARSFISEVDFAEIAETINSDLKVEA